MAANLPATTSPGGSGNALEYGNWTPAFFKPHARSIGGIVAQVTIDEQASDDVQITEHPVEQGAPIADHAFKRPASVTIRAGWSRQFAWDLSAETGVYGLLLSWQAALLPFDVYTGKRKYTNMLIERLQVQTDQHLEYTLMATISCRQVIIVGTSTTTVTGMSPNAGDQTDPSQTGQESDQGDKQAEQSGDAYPDTTPDNVISDGSDSPNESSTPEAGSVTNQMGANGATAPNNPPVQTPGALDLSGQPQESIINTTPTPQRSPLAVRLPPPRRRGRRF